MNNKTASSFAALPIVSTDQFIPAMEALSALMIVLGCMGGAANVVNIHTFLSMGLDDGVTVSFFSLACSDLVYLLFMVALGVNCFFLTWEMRTGYRTWFPADPTAIGTNLAEYCSTFYLMTVLTTTFLAVARCMCVARPLQFKFWFTKVKSLAILTAFLIFSVGLQTPRFVNMKLRKEFDGRINASRTVLWLSQNFERVNFILSAVLDSVIPPASEIIIIVCVVIMADKLRQSTRFRQSATTTTTTISLIGNSQSSEQNRETLNGCHDNGTHNVSKIVNTDLYGPSMSHSAASKGKLSGKELQVVQQVVLISLVYIVCNCPQIAMTTAYIVVPDLGYGEKDEMLLILGCNGTFIFRMINSSVNIFIYLKYNSKFRNSCCISSVKPK